MKFIPEAHEIWKLESLEIKLFNFQVICWHYPPSAVDFCWWSHFLGDVRQSAFARTESRAQMIASRGHIVVRVDPRFYDTLACMSGGMLVGFHSL